MEQKFDPTKPVQTRDGREAGIYAADAGGDYPVHGWYRDTDGNKRNISLTIHGGYSIYMRDHELDFINTPEPEVVRYANVYVGSDTIFLRNCREDCDVRTARGRIACIRITYRPGQFDE